MDRDLVFVSGPVGNPAESHGTSLDLVLGVYGKRNPLDFLGGYLTACLLNPHLAAPLTKI